jgi:hypothetical protein
MGAGREIPASEEVFRLVHALDDRDRKDAMALLAGRVRQLEHDVDALTAERDKLRAALEAIASARVAGPHLLAGYMTLQEAAREALGR